MAKIIIDTDKIEGVDLAPKPKMHWLLRLFLSLICVLVIAFVFYNLG